MAKDTNATAKTSFNVLDDRSILFLGKPVEKTQIHLPLTAGWVSAIRLELLPHEAHHGTILRGDKDSTTISIAATLKGQGKSKETKISFYHAEADHKEERYANGFAIVGVKDAWKTSVQHRTSRQTAVWLLDRPMRANPGDTLTVTLGNSTVGRLRVGITPFAAQDPLKSGEATRSPRHWPGRPGQEARWSRKPICWPRDGTPMHSLSSKSSSAKSLNAATVALPR